jgi:undecaprenyl-diphosphatase
VNVTTALVLGVVQGLTEFLPISSSGHLAIAQHFLPGFDKPSVLFNIVLHLGTLGSVLIYLRREVAMLLSGLVPGGSGRLGRRLIVLLVLGTLPAVVVALGFGDYVEESFERLSVVGGALLVTGLILLVSSRCSMQGRGLDEIVAKDALLVGLAQSAALLPGISRSGSTIVAGLMRGIDHAAAARFSFLLSIPTILGAAVFKFKDVALVSGDAVLGYVVGFSTAFAIGYLAIGIVIKLLDSKRFHLFGYYCLGMGGAVLVYIAFGSS